MTKTDLILEHLTYANCLAKRYKKHSSCSLDELISAAYMGLVEAASKFDISKNVKFTTYAYWKIHSSILDYIRETKFYLPILTDISHASKVTFFELIDGLTDINREVIILYYINGYTLNEIAEKIGYSKSRVGQIKEESERILKRNLAA